MLPLKFLDYDDCACLNSGPRAWVMIRTAPAVLAWQMATHGVSWQHCWQRIHRKSPYCMHCTQSLLLYIFWCFSAINCSLFLPVNAKVSSHHLFTDLKLQDLCTRLLSVHQRELGSVENLQLEMIPVTGHSSKAFFFYKFILEQSIHYRLFALQSIYLKISSAGMLIKFISV